MKRMARVPDVPFLDLARSHVDLDSPLLADFRSLIHSAQFVNGPQVEAFEREFAAYCESIDCVGVSSGLDALRLALAALDVGPGDEVIVPAMTFVATFEAVTQVGAIPVPVDVHEESYCLDAAAVEAALTPRTRALVPVHLYGQMADVAALRRLASAHKLHIVEDACQAHGARRDGSGPAKATAAAAFSFYPGKNLGAMGDAGALVSDDTALTDRVRALREHGQRQKYEHDEIGWTARLDTIQAIVLLRKLPRLEAWNAERRAVAAYYTQQLHKVGDLVVPTEVSGSEHVWHLYVVRTANPSGLAAFLAERGIRTGRHYPRPPHLTDAYSHLGFPRGSFPVAERLGAECLSLPVFPGITEAQLEHVVDSVQGWFTRG
jgi:dTDP-3-amino-3,4,6-trideoxy-alpha-D-glucose transaminase